MADYPNTPWGTLQRLKDKQAGHAPLPDEVPVTAESETAELTPSKKKAKKKK